MQPWQFVGCLVLSLCWADVALAGSSNSLMDVTADGHHLLVANADNGTVTLVETTLRKAIRETHVGDEPEGVTWLGSGSKAAVAVYRANHVVFLDPHAGRVIATVDVPAEPYGIVSNRAGSRVWVTHEYPGVVSEIDTASHRIVRTMHVARFIRGLALSPDEKSLYVTGYYNGVLYAVDLASGRVTDQWQGHSTDNLCRNVVVHPRRPKAYLPHQRSMIATVHGSGSIFPHLSICDLGPAHSESRRKALALDSFNGSLQVVCSPWEVALSPDGRSCYIIHAGTDDVTACNVIDDDYRELKRRGWRTHVGHNPRAVRVSPDNRLVYIDNTLDFNVTVHDARDMHRLATIKVCDAPRSSTWVRGKILFNTALPPMTRRHWIACASCHPDGHTDGRVWHNPEGLRKTTALFGVAHTHPLHWSADRDEVQDFEYTIRGPLMQGAGLVNGSITPKDGFKATELAEHMAGRSAELDALAVYTNSFDFTLSPHILAPGKLTPAAERGRKLFFRADVGCSACHSGSYFTDSSLTKPFHLHDVGTGDDPTEKIGPRYDTPTLLGVYRTAPYLHTGKAATLRDVLTTCNRQDRHGKTSHLTSAEIDDLVAFLKSLPYEPPPLVTPNTVTYSELKADVGQQPPRPVSVKSRQAELDGRP